MKGYFLTNCQNRESCKNRDSQSCNNCSRNQATKSDNYKHESKGLFSTITTNGC